MSVSTEPAASLADTPLAAALAAHDDRLSNCVHCGFCLPACPTYVRLGDEADSPRGRLHLMRAVSEGRLDPAKQAFQIHIDRCLGCRACETVCPSGVEYGFLLERAREVAVSAGGGSAPASALLTMIRTPMILTSAMGIGRILRGIRIASLLSRIMPRWQGLRGARLALAMLASSEEWKAPVNGSASASTVARVAPRRREETEGVESGSRARGRVGVLAGCVQRHLFKRVNEATTRVLEANGFEVVRVPGQGCCGALHAHAGQLDASREMALANIRAFRQAGLDFVVANAAGCGATMRDYHHLVQGPVDNDDARWFSERVRDISEILVTSDGHLPVRGGSLPIKVAYDPPCHLLHGQRIASPPIELLRSIPGLEVLSVPKGEECCGGAGIYGITHPDLGGRIGSDKVEAVVSTGAHVLATGNPGCAMQIGAGLHLRGSDIQVAHPVELLDESYRRGGLYAR